MPLDVRAYTAPRPKAPPFAFTSQTFWIRPVWRIGLYHLRWAGFRLAVFLCNNYNYITLHSTGSWVGFICRTSSPTLPPAVTAPTPGAIFSRYSFSWMTSWIHRSTVLNTERINPRLDNIAGEFISRVSLRTHNTLALLQQCMVLFSIHDRATKWQL